MLHFPGQGLVPQVFSQRPCALLHLGSRYSGKRQPLLRDFPRGKVTFTYNGNILNFREIEEDAARGDKLPLSVRLPVFPGAGCPLGHKKRRYHQGPPGIHGDPLGWEDPVPKPLSPS